MPSTPYQTTDYPGTGKDLYELQIPVFACSAIADANELTDLVLGHPFEVLGIDFVAVTPITTAAKTTTIKPYIDGVVVPGTATAVAGAKAKGVVSTAFRAATTGRIFGTATSKLTLTCSATTAFVEGTGYWVVKLRNI